MAKKTLYVGNIPYSVTEGDLIQAFSSFGGNNARIIEGRGFAFIDVDDEHLEAAIAAKNNTDLGGRAVTVNEARPKVGKDGGGRSRGW
ncbi:MAG: hypothetical protein HONBIEJF_00541 [Fimbriimonadaceae bacterium]|nr:hypothetical protein [Fimbriimonadaceae bacterium]